MGQGGSQEPPPSPPPRLPPSPPSSSPPPPSPPSASELVKSSSDSCSFSKHVEFFMDLEPFPDEILMLILSFVPPRDLLLCGRYVSQRWKRLVDCPSLWRIKCEREHRRDILSAAEMCPKFSWQRVCLKKPFSRNLLRNPCGSERLNHWSAVHGGDGWIVEDSRSVIEGAESQTCFVTSYGWCEKSQIIDLLQAGLWEHFLDVHQPVICISDWYAGRQDCGCVYRMKVQLLAADKKTVIKQFTINPDPIPQWNDASYHQVSHEFRQYGPGVRYVHFSHKGKDTQFWKDWYGARISNSSVTVTCGNLEPCRESPNLHIVSVNRGSTKIVVSKRLLCHKPKE